MCGTRLNTRVKFGSAQISVDGNIETVSGLTGSGWQIGGTRAVGAGEIRALVSRYGTTAAGRPRSTKLSLGLRHSF